MQYIWITGWWVGFTIVTLFLARSLHRVIGKIRRPRDKLRSGTLQDLTPTLNGAKFEIIAVPGLGAHPYHTWESSRTSGSTAAEHQTSQSAKIHLLKDLLARDFPEAKIWNFAHDSNWLIDAPAKTTEEIGSCLLKEVKNKQPVSHLPIIFIGHSLGGIIIKQALCRSDAQDVVDRTAGVIFLGAPHQGSSVSIAGAVLASVTGILGSDTTLLLSLKNHNTGLSNLTDAFSSRIASNERRQQKVPIISFYETKKTYLLGLSLGVVVSRDSAMVHADANESHSIETDHSGLNKCSGPNDALFKQLSMAIRRLKTPSLLEQADALIRYKHYTPERLRIQRLSGETLPMDQCYINLTILERRGQDGDYSTNQADRKPAASSLFALQKIETADETTQIELSNLFNERKESDGRCLHPRRILIRGRAGVGKTTLCKKIVSEFTKGTWAQWNELFDRVLWVPLRNLKLPERRRMAKYTFEDLLSHEFLLPTNGQNLARVLSSILEADNNKTLFILDGLDELSQDLTGGGGMHRFLEMLLEQPNAIITSRPSARSPTKVDLELETIGFSPDQVNEYIEKSFTNPETGEKDLAKIDDVRSFLEKRWLIQGLVRIPIQLDALCYTWEELDPENVPRTMTGMYYTMVQKLWKKDMVRLEKTEQAYAEDAHAAEIEDRVTTENELVERFAFNGLHNNIIDFTPAHRTSMVFLWPGQNLSLDETLSRLSFFRVSHTEPRIKRRNYHFIHLTYQEYFAARYFARQWKDPEGQLQTITFGSTGTTTETIRPIKFLQRHKYTARYDIFWRFVAGLLDRSGQALNLIYAIKAKPVDLLGPTHQRLIMHCLSEISGKLPIREALEKQLTEWLLFECRFNQSATLASELEFPEAALKTALRSVTGVTQAIILDSLAKRAFLSQGIIEYVAGQFGDPDRDVRRVAVDALGGCSALPDDVIVALTRRLEDNDVLVRMSAVKVLGARSGLPVEATLLARRLDDEDERVRRAAVEVLCKRSGPTDKVLAAVARRLEDSNSLVREVTVAGLGWRSVLPDDILMAVAERLDDDDWNVRQTAIKALSERSALPDMVQTAIFRKIYDEHLNVGIAAMRAFGGRSILPDAVMVALVGKLCRNLLFEGEEAQAVLSRSSALPNEALIAKWLDKGPTIRKAAIIALGERSVLPDEVLTAVASQLADKDLLIRRAAIISLGRRPVLPEEILAAIIERLDDKDSIVREVAVEVQGTRPALSEQVLAAVTRRLEDADPAVRKAAVVVLGGRPALPEQVLAAVTRRFEDLDPTVRKAVVKALGSRSVLLSHEVLEAITRRLDDKDSIVRAAAVEVLGARTELPERVLAAVTRRLHDAEFFVQEAAVEVLGRRPVLSDEVLATLPRLADSRDWRVPDAPVKVLTRRLALSDPLLMAVVRRLDDAASLLHDLIILTLGERPVLSYQVLEVIARRLKDRDFRVRDAAVQVLGGRPEVPAQMLAAVAGRLHDASIRKQVVKILGGRPVLPDEALAVVAKALNDEIWDVRFAAVELLSRRPALPDAMLEALATRFDDEALWLRQDSVDAFIKNLHRVYRTRSLIACLYKALLKKSFEDQVSWYVEDGKPVVNMPDGTRELDIRTPLHDVMQWIHEARPTDYPLTGS